MLLAQLALGYACLIPHNFSTWQTCIMGRLIHLLDSSPGARL